MIIKITAEQVRQPEDSQHVLIANHEASNSDGAVRGELRFEENGKIIVPPHRHLMVSGEDPPAGPRYFPIRLK
jgi:hypothetical protein